MNKIINLDHDAVLIIVYYFRYYAGPSTQLAAEYLLVLTRNRSGTARYKPLLQVIIKIVIQYNGSAQSLYTKEKSPTIKGSLIFRHQIIH